LIKFISGFEGHYTKIAFVSDDDLEMVPDKEKNNLHEQFRDRFKELKFWFVSVLPCVNGH